MTGRALVLRGNARALPLPDESVDLVVTSPPYWRIRSYVDGGSAYEAQVGSEPMPGQYLDSLLACMREMVRVLKPSGSIWVNLGDVYSARAGAGPNAIRDGRNVMPSPSPAGTGIREKSLCGLPWRFALRCVDELGLILRRDQIWHKPSAMPESVTDRTRSAHEYIFHLVKQPRYFAAVDEIRQPHVRSWTPGANGGHTAFVARGNGHTNSGLETAAPHGLGSLPGSVWEIASEPLRIPDHLNLAQHYAAFPLELPRRIIAGWSPPGICVECGEGRRPEVHRSRDTFYGKGRHRSGAQQVADGAAETGWAMDEKWRAVATIAGYACGCAPYTDHPGSGSTTRRGYNPGLRDNNAQGTYGRHQAGEYERVGPWREYHLDGWTPPPSRPAVVLDPFAGTGTTMLAAKALGRIGVGVDRSMDYCRLAAWRTTNPGELAKAMRVDKPPPQLDGQDALFDLTEVTG